MTDTANPTINYGITNLNQYSSASNESVTNGPEHEVSSFQGLYDTQPVNYHYLNDEHLISIDSGGGTRYFYYDAVGRCVKRSPTVANGGNTTYYIYDGEKPILEYSSSGIVGRNVYGKGIDEILMRTNPGVNDGYPIYYAQDHEGSVTHLLDGRSSPASQTGNVIEQYHYDAFGLPTFYDANTNQINSTAYNNRFLFTGREYAATYRSIYVPEFRFYEYRARAYHPDLGRFMSEDPKLFDAGDYNLFRYCHNDPIDSVDPMGTANMPYHWTPELMDFYYGKSMAASQWQNSGAIQVGIGGYNMFSSILHTLAGLVTGNANGGANPPPTSKYARGEAYSAERSAENFQPNIKPNGNIVITSMIYIKVFDSNHAAVPAGTAVSETAVPVKDSRSLVQAPERKYFTSYTDSNGQVHHPDIWQHVFSSRDGFVTRSQTLEANGNHLHWTGTQNINGMQIGPHQTAYFLQPGVPGY